MLPYTVHKTSGIVHNWEEYRDQGSSGYQGSGREAKVREEEGSNPLKIGNRELVHSCTPLP
jgi:hypothetical protein